MAVGSFWCDTWLWHNLFAELNLFMTKNGENITLCVTYCHFLFVSVNECICASFCVRRVLACGNMNVFVEVAMVGTNLAKSILQYVILHFIFSTFNHFHTMRTITTIAAAAATTAKGNDDDDNSDDHCRNATVQSTRNIMCSFSIQKPF